MPNAEFAAFVAVAGYVTLAERPLDPALYPDAKPELAVPGALVFRMTDGPVDTRDLRQWWHYVPGACWNRPEGPGSDLADRDAHPVVHVAFIPVIGMHVMGTSNHVSPATGRPYVWNDIQAYKDTANGQWDDKLWGLIPGIMKKYNRPCYTLRPGFENKQRHEPHRLPLRRPRQRADVRRILNPLVWP